jgi:hypothetical protein
MTKLLITCVILCALVVGCVHLTREQEAAIKAGGSVAAPFFGLPPIVGESVAATLIAIISGFAGHKNGRRKERTCRGVAHVSGK